MEDKELKQNEWKIHMLKLESEKYNATLKDIKKEYSIKKN